MKEKERTLKDFIIEDLDKIDLHEQGLIYRYLRAIITRQPDLIVPRKKAIEKYIKAQQKKAKG